MSSPQDSETNRAAREKTREGARLLNTGDYQGAIVACTNAIQVDPQYDDAYLLRTEAYRRTNKPSLLRFIFAPLVFIWASFVFIWRYLWWVMFDAADSLGRASGVNQPPRPRFREHDQQHQQSKLARERVQALLVPTAVERAEEIRGLGISAGALKSTPESYHRPGPVSVRKWQRMVVYRGGQVHKVSRPGMRFVIPRLEKARIVDLREQTEQFPIMAYMTQDRVQVNFHLVVHYRFIPECAEQIVGEEQEYRLWT